MNQQLAKVIAGSRALELARTIPEVKVIRDQAKAIADYCKQQKYAGRAAIDARELQFRAEWKLGELIPQQFPEGRPSKEKLSHGAIVSLKQNNISLTQSSRWQKARRASDLLIACSMMQPMNV